MDIYVDIGQDNFLVSRGSLHDFVSYNEYEGKQKGNDMIVLSELSVRNFLSFGNTPQVIDLEKSPITGIVGINLDSSEVVSRNGAGKSSILDAISYVLYGKAVRKISNQKLVNKFAKSGMPMLVTLTLRDDKYRYRIERGEKPSKLVMFKMPLSETGEITEIEDGVGKWGVNKNKPELNEDILGIVKMDHLLFTLLAGCTTEQTPFMELPEDKRRTTIETLMGLDILSAKADALKSERLVAKKTLHVMEGELVANERHNEKTERMILEQEHKKEAWKVQIERQISKLRESISQYENVDVEHEIEKITAITELLRQIEEKESMLSRLQSDRKNANSMLRQIKGNIERTEAILSAAEADLEASGRGVCKTCGRPLETAKNGHRDDLREKVRTLEADLSDMLVEYDEYVDKSESFASLCSDTKTELETLERDLDQLGDSMFDSVESAMKVSETITRINEQIVELEQKECPYDETISTLKENIINIDYAAYEAQNKLILNYDYLINLLQSKDSFIRKHIISKWTPFLNRQIKHYLSVLELHHKVSINDTFGIEISDLGNTYDLGNLSRGQRQRVNLALTLSFVDLYELVNDPLNILFVDELLDAGFCSRGAERSLDILIEQSNKRGKNVFVVTHRQDIFDKIDDVMTVTLKNRVSTIEWRAA